MNTHAMQAIEALGGTAAVARLCEVSMPSVSGWKEAGIPRSRILYLRAVRGDQLVDIDLDAATSKVGAPEPAPEGEDANA